MGKLLLLMAALMAAGTYMLPTIIAMARDHPNTWLIGAINVTTGRTILGWCFALAEVLKPLLAPHRHFRRQFRLKLRRQPTAITQLDITNSNQTIGGMT